MKNMVYVVTDKDRVVYSVNSSWRAAYLNMIQLMADLGLRVTDVQHMEVADIFPCEYPETGERDEFSIDEYEVDDPSIVH